MAFSITGLRSFAWPDESQVSASLQPYDLALDELGAAIRSFTDDTDPGVNRYTEALAANLAKHLRAATSPEVESNGAHSRVAVGAH